MPHRQRDFHTTTQEAQKSAYQNRAAKSREKYQKELAEYNASKKAAAKADAAAPAAEAAPKKRKKSKSEDGGEKKKVAFQRGRAFKFMSTILSLSQDLCNRRPFHLCSPAQRKKSKKKDKDTA